MRFLLDISFDGSSFRGYAKQKHKNTIRDEIEDTLSKMFKQHISTKATSRTDSKVHALQFYLVFDLEKLIEENKLKGAINKAINKAICVNKVYQVKQDYVPRYDVLSKTYTYRINKEYNPLRRNYVYNYQGNINISLMKKASKYLIGTHDFTSFCASNSYVTNKVRTISKIKIYKDINNDICIDITGDGFLYNQVRIIIGTLLYISNNNLEPELMLNVLNAKDRKKAYDTVPPQGLYLKQTKLGEYK